MTDGIGKPSCSNLGRTLGPRRVLNDDERRKLTVDAWGLITFFQEAGLVQPDELDEALLYLTTLDINEVDTPEVVWVLSNVIQDTQRVAMILGRARGESEAGGDEDEDEAGPRIVH